MSRELSPINSDDFALMEKVSELDWQGENPTAIAKALSIPRKEVLGLLAQYRQIVINDAESRDIARDYLHRMVKHYDNLIKGYYDLIKDLQLLNFSHQVAAQINSAMKEIGSLEAKRLEALQKAGLLDASDLGDEIAENERKMEVLIGILRNDLCNACGPKVARKLQEVTNQVEVIRVENG